MGRESYSLSSEFVSSFQTFSKRNYTIWVAILLHSALLVQLVTIYFIGKPRSWVLQRVPIKVVYFFLQFIFLRIIRLNRPKWHLQQGSTILTSIRMGASV